MLLSFFHNTMTIDDLKRQKTKTISLPGQRHADVEQQLTISVHNHPRTIRPSHFKAGLRHMGQSS